MIENNPISSLPAKPADQLQATDKKTRSIGQLPLENEHDKVVLSDKAKLIAKVASAAKESPQVQSERVERVTKQVQDGLYQVPVNQLANIIFDRLYTNK